MLALLTALVLDVAQQIGCFTGVRDSVVANTVLALGTSIPGAVSRAEHAEVKGLGGGGGLKLLGDPARGPGILDRNVGVVTR